MLLLNVSKQGVRSFYQKFQPVCIKELRCRKRDELRPFDASDNKVPEFPNIAKSINMVTRMRYKTRKSIGNSSHCRGAARIPGNFTCRQILSNSAKTRRICDREKNEQAGRPMSI